MHEHCRRSIMKMLVSHHKTIRSCREHAERHGDKALGEHYRSQEEVVGRMMHEIDYKDEQNDQKRA